VYSLLGGANFVSWLSVTSGSYQCNLSWLLNYPHKHKAVEMALLSDPKAKIWVVPVRFRHLGFSTSDFSSLVVHHCQWSCWIAGPRRHRCSRWIFVAILYWSKYISYSLSTSGLWPPYWISHFRLHNTILTLVQLWSWTPQKWGYSRWNFVAISDRRISCLSIHFGFMAAILDFLWYRRVLLLTKTLSASN